MRLVHAIRNEKKKREKIHDDARRTESCCPLNTTHTICHSTHATYNHVPSCVTFFHVPSFPAAVPRLLPCAPAFPRGPSIFGEITFRLIREETPRRPLNIFGCLSSLLSFPVRFVKHRSNEIRYTYIYVSRCVLTGGAFLLFIVGSCALLRCNVLLCPFREVCCM